MTRSLSILNELRLLQAKQRMHDERFDARVQKLSLARIMSHTVELWAVYGGRLAGIQETEVNLLARNVVDAFIACLGAASALDMDVATNLLGTHAAKLGSLKDIAAFLFVKNGQPDLGKAPNVWLLSRLAQVNGRLAELCIAHEQGKRLDYQAGWRQGVAEIANDILILTHARELNLSSMIKAHWALVERQAVHAP